MSAQGEFNIGFSPKGHVRVPFQKLFILTVPSDETGQNILNELHALQISAAGLVATRRVATNTNAVVHVGMGKRAVLTFLCADKSTVKIKIEHFNPTQSADTLGAALVGHLKNAAASVTTAYVETFIQSVEYV